MDTYGSLTNPATLADHQGAATRQNRNSSSSTTLVSVASDGTQGESWDQNPALSANGRYVAFQSESQNLVGGDDNGHMDIFVRERLPGGETILASISPSNTLWDGDSVNPVISNDGRYVAFQNRARLLEGRNVHDIYVRDLETGQTSQVNVTFDGTPPDGSSWYPAISADGRYVAFASEAQNLVPGDTNGYEDVFVRDRLTGETRRVSVATDGTQGNGYSGGGSVWGPDPPRGGVAISADGRYVAFVSGAYNLVVGDGNQSTDIFVHDLWTRETTRASSTSAGTQANWDSLAPDISADGRYVVFESYADNLVPTDTTRGFTDIFVRDRVAQQTTRVSLASDGTESNDHSFKPSISADGRYVAFGSQADNLVSGDTNNYWDVLVHDRHTGQTSRVSVANSGFQGNSDSPVLDDGAIDISRDGRYVVFDSDADNLVLGDTDWNYDVFLRDRGSHIRPSVSITTPTLTPGSSTTPGDPSVYVRYYKGQPATTPDGQTVISQWHLYVLSNGNDNLSLSSVPDPIAAVPPTDLQQQANACWVVCLDGDDIVTGTDSPDTPVHTNQGADRLNLRGGDDLALGGHGSDVMNGEGGDDVLAGNQETDLLIGGEGADWLLGGQGEDILMGDAGADLLNGDVDRDLLIGGGGGDTYVLRSDAEAVSSTLQQADVIVDFNVAEGDRIGLTGGTQFADLAFEAIDLTLDGVSSVSTAIRLGATGFYLAIVQGMVPESLDASLFIS